MLTPSPITCFCCSKISSAARYEHPPPGAQPPTGASKRAAMHLHAPRAAGTRRGIAALASQHGLMLLLTGVTAKGFRLPHQKQEGRALTSAIKRLNTAQLNLA
eukprot:16443504-Heterocapsa_arctica.AAC.1